MSYSGEDIENKQYNEHSFVRKTNQSLFKKVQTDLGFLLSGKNAPLLISLFIVGCSFFLIAGVSYEVYDLLRDKLLNSSLERSTLSTLSYVGFFFIIIPIFGQVLVANRLHNTKAIVLIALILFYITGQIIGFSLVFLGYGVSKEWLWVFAIAGGVFLLFAFIGYFVPWINKLWKYIAVISVIWIFAMITLLILKFAIPSIYINDIYLIMIGIFGLLTMFYIAFDIYNLKNYIHQIGNEKLTINVILFLSFRLLIHLMNLIWILARFFIFNRR